MSTSVFTGSGVVATFGGFHVALTSFFPVLPVCSRTTGWQRRA